MMRVVALVAVCFVAGCCHDQPAKTATEGKLVPSTMATAEEDNRCIQHPETWSSTFVEKQDASGQIYKEALWTVDAPCEGGHGTLVKTMRVWFYRDVPGVTITGRPVPHTLRAIITLWVKMDAPATLTQSWQLFNPRGSGLFAVGPYQWEHDSPGTYECATYYATYPDTEYANLAKCCRLPSECK